MAQQVVTTPAINHAMNAMRQVSEECDRLRKIEERTAYSIALHAINNVKQDDNELMIFKSVRKALSDLSEVEDRLFCIDIGIDKEQNN